MSSRLRIIVSSLGEGMYYGGYAKRRIAELAGDAFVKPDPKLTGVRRTADLAKQLGWNVHLYRVPRGVALVRTKFGQELLKAGILPRKPRKVKNDYKKVEFRRADGLPDVVPAPGAFIPVQGNPRQVINWAGPELIWHNANNLQPQINGEQRIRQIRRELDDLAVNDDFLGGEEPAF